MSAAPTPSPSLREASRAALGFPGAEDLRETPEVVIDSARLLANIARARTIVPGTVSLRPHAKTHKTLEIARLQITAGASGITCAKPGEAIVFIEAGVPSVTVAYPVVRPEPARAVLRAARARGASAAFAADSAIGVEAIALAAREEQVSARLFVEIDTGLRRCGVDPSGEQAFLLSHVAATSPGLVFAGLFTHEGHTYGARGRTEVSQRARAARETMLSVADRLRKAGLDVPTISMGSTPSLLADGGFEGVTEFRPGNYVFLDLTAVRLGVAKFADVALAVVTTVVSVNDTYAIVDAGSKTLSSDQRPHAAEPTPGFGLAFPLAGEDAGTPFAVARLSEEHGWLAREGRSAKIGDRMLIVPNHSCVVANLAERMVLLTRGAKPERWRVAARGQVR